MASIFLSYAREDLDKAKMLAAALEQQGWCVFWDHLSILPGADFDEVIEQAISQAHCMIVGWSSASKKSDWVRGEATIGRQRRILLPVFFEKVEPPIAFRGLHTEDFSDWQGDISASAFQALCRALQQRSPLNNPEVPKVAEINPETPTASPEVKLELPDPKPTPSSEKSTELPEAPPVKSPFKINKLVIGVLAVGLSFGGIYAISQNTAITKTTDVKVEDESIKSASIPQVMPKNNVKLPEMIRIPAGEFWMGSADDDKAATDDEKPRHLVKMAAFGLGKYEVTKAEFAEFITQSQHEITGCMIWDGSKWQEDKSKNWQNPGFEQSGNDPVACVNHQDATAYIAWLNTATNGHYRLPTEAEWEYAARAKTTEAYYWGQAQPDDFAWYADNSGSKTHPVGQKQPNDFRLFDMAGNVWEWTDDCWHSSYQGAPANGVAWREENNGDCSRRVLRGGSWNYRPDNLRSAYRLWYNPVYRLDFIGFRLAQDLP